MTDGRPSPSAQGTFERTPFAHVLMYIRERSLTGTLALETEDPELFGETLIAFEGGAIAQVRFPRLLDPLGDVLRDQGVITEAQLAEATARLEHGEGLLGEIVVAMGACEPDAIDRAVLEQIRRKSTRWFAVRAALYQYFNAVDLLAGWGADRPRVDVFAALARGLRAHPDQPAIDGVLARVGTQYLRLRQPNETRLFEFDRNEQAVLDLLRVEPMQLERLLRAGRDPRVARVVAYLLLITKQVELSAGVPAPRVATGQHTIATASPRVATGQHTIPTASPTRAAPAPAPPPAAKISLPPPPAPSVPAEHRERLREAEERLAAIEDQNYFEMFGLPTSASAEAVREAFLAQASRWHPDRAPAGVEPIRTIYEKIFAYLSEAQDTLVTDEARGRYLHTAQDGGGTPAAQRRIAALIDAATSTQKAEVCLKRREWDEAERLARYALAIAPDDPNTLAVLAATLLERRADAPTDEPLALLERAVSLVPKHDRAQTLLGMVYKRRGDATRALEHFRIAADANARNMDAAREVRIAEMRARGGGTLADGTPRPKTGEGFLSKLLKK